MDLLQKLAGKVCGTCSSSNGRELEILFPEDVKSTANRKYYREKEAQRHYILGCAAQEENKLAEAINHYREALICFPHHIDSTYNLGSAYHELGQSGWREAEYYYKKTIELNDRHSMALYNLGYLYQDMKKGDLSIICFQMAANIEPLDPDIHINLGLAYKAENRIEDAINSYKKAIDLDPNCIMANFNLGNTYQEISNFDLAITMFKEALRCDPNHVDALYNMGIAWQEKAANTTSKSDAKQWINEAIKCYHKVSHRIKDAEVAEIYLKELIKSENYM